MEDHAFEFPTAKSVAQYVRKNASAVKKAAAGMAMDMGRAGGMESVREDHYDGHHIVIRTTYTIEVDGRTVMAHLALTNDGQVQYHGLPNYSFGSAVDLVKKMIDVYPDDFSTAVEASHTAHTEGAEPHDGMHMHRPGAAMAAGKSGSAGRPQRKPRRKR